MKNSNVEIKFFAGALLILLVIIYGITISSSNHSNSSKLSASHLDIRIVNLNLTKKANSNKNFYPNLNPDCKSISNQFCYNLNCIDSIDTKALSDLISDSKKLLVINRHGIRTAAIGRKAFACGRNHVDEEFFKSYKKDFKLWKMFETLMTGKTCSRSKLTGYGVQQLLKIGKVFKKVIPKENYSKIEYFSTGYPRTIHSATAFRMRYDGNYSIDTLDTTTYKLYPKATTTECKTEKVELVEQREKQEYEAHNSCMKSISGPRFKLSDRISEICMGEEPLPNVFKEESVCNRVKCSKIISILQQSHFIQLINDWLLDDTKILKIVSAHDWNIQDLICLYTNDEYTPTFVSLASSLIFTDTQLILLSGGDITVYSSYRSAEEVAEILKSSSVSESCTSSVFNLWNNIN